VFVPALLWIPGSATQPQEKRIMGNVVPFTAPVPAASSRAAATTSAREVLAASIERVVQSRTGGKIQALKVVVERDGVCLQGRCATFYSKQLAQHAAMDLSGELTLTNEIEVR
jgi:osmotically-inducible protein OsmY